MDTKEEIDSMNEYQSDYSSDSQSDAINPNEGNYTIAELKALLQDRLLNQPKRYNILGRRNALK